MNEFEDFHALFEEILTIADETKFLLEDEKNMEHFKTNLESQIEKIHFFLGSEWEKMEISKENIEKIEQLIGSVRSVFKEINTFFSHPLSKLNKNQEAIQTYTQRILRELSIS